jgi:lysophospholipase L1-like esterase
MTMHDERTRGSATTARARRAMRVVLLAAAASACSSPNGPTPPVSLTCPTVAAVESLSGAPVAVTYVTPTATNGTRTIPVSCTPASGSSFPVGDTRVNCASTDTKNAASCSFVVTVKTAPRLLYTQFLAFGDSITEGKLSDPVGTSLAFEARLRQLDFATRSALLEEALISSPATSYETGLAQRLAARYTQQTFSVLNDGLGGESAASGASPGVFRFPGSIGANNPQVVLLMEGTNDLLSPSGGDPAIQALDTMIGVALSQGRRVVLATIPPQRAGGLNNRSGVAARIPAFNDQIRTLAATRHVVLCDVYNAMKDDIQHLIGVDDLHPTVQGYQVIADTFYNAVRQNFEQGATAQPATPPSLAPFLW